MSKKPTVSSGDESKRGNDNFKGFINYHMTDQRKKEADHFLLNFDIVGNVEKAIGEGYKFSLSLDARQGRFLCSMSTKSGDNSGYILTARAGDITQALGRVMFLHIVVFDLGAWSDQQEVDQDAW